MEEEDESKRKSENYLEVSSPEGSQTAMLESKIDIRDSEEYRKVYLNNIAKNEEQEYCSNVVITSKYTVWNFLPIFLMESFRKLANAYFLLVSILQSVPSISNTGGIPTNAPVLMFILGVDAILAIIEDRRRHLADTESNSATCHVLKMGKLEDITWADLTMGSIIQVRNRETAPADILILAACEPNVEVVSGICYVETKSLDGETNLKLRQAVEDTMHQQSEQEISTLKGIVTSETPNTSIGKFSATIQLQGKSIVPITMNNMILRGCQLRNTEYVYGLVLNTGDDTKIMQSSVNAPVKWSSINALVNKMIVGLFLFLLVLCLIATIVQVVWNESYAESASYLQWNPDGASQFFLGFGYYFLLMYQLIPVSLYVTISMVMFIQAVFMTLDLEMYYDVTDTRAIVRTMGLNDELGQISYVFSDKTGTLTCNVMDFRKCYINGISYGQGTTEIGNSNRLRQGLPAIEDDPNQKSSRPDMQYVNFYDPALEEIFEKKEPTEQYQKICSFFTHLAVCHTVIPETLPSGELRLSASSPDEQALVAGANYFGFSFKSRGAKGVANVVLQDQEKQFVILNVLEFSSDRKRMSVIVKDPEGALLLLTKGADSVMKTRLSKQCMENDWEQADKFMEEYADEGLRTLCIGSKVLHDSDYETWDKKFGDASGDLAQIELRKNGESNSIDDLMNEMEVDLELIGVTAIEDKLQSKVPQTIATLEDAYIKVWMLTGDKQETAINIAFACQLVTVEMEQIIFNRKLFSNDEALMNEFVKYKEIVKQDAETTMFALIIDGETLETVLANEELRQLFVEIAVVCRGVVCCRVSPSQKAEVVELVKDYSPEARTLSIGDGANDVAMIQKAHIGIGISGQEGMQAVNSSDYAIAQFHFLQKLLLHHGRLNYFRMSTLVGYMFYKNMVMVLTQYYFMFHTGTSGQKIYNELGFQLFNVALTALPIIYLGVFDEDVPFSVCQLFPKLYCPGQTMQLFNIRVFINWMGSAIFESAVIYVMTVYAYSNYDAAVGSAGLAQYGIVAFTLVIIVCNLKLYLLQTSWTIWSIMLSFVGVITWCPVALYVASNLIEIFPMDFGIFNNTLDDMFFWLIVPITIVIALGRNFTWKAIQRSWFPTYGQIVQEKYALHSFAKILSSSKGEPKARLSCDSQRSPIDVALKRRKSSGYAFSCHSPTTRKESSLATGGSPN